MLRIWGRISSINVRKVVWAAQELGLPFERIDAGLQHGVVRTAAYRALNPNALVPTVEDGASVLWESNVIIRHLCAHHGRPGGALTYPQDLAQRFDQERWMDWQQTTLNPAGREAFIQWFRTPEAQRNPAAIAASTAATEPLLDVLDQLLAQRPWISGAHFGMADIPIGCELHRWMGLPQPHPPRPHLDDWYARIRARPATRGVLDLSLA